MNVSQLAAFLKMERRTVRDMMNGVTCDPRLSTVTVIEKKTGLKAESYLGVK